MAYTVTHDGIVFIEGSHPTATRGPQVECNLIFKSGAHLKSLRDVKDELAYQASSRGYNCIMDFRYGQKTSPMAIDKVGFWGRGYLANLSAGQYEEKPIFCANCGYNLRIETGMAKFCPKCGAKIP